MKNNKTYSFKTILNKGRFKNYYSSLSNALKEEIKLNCKKYSEKYQEYCSKRNREFLVNVFFVLASYDALVNNGHSKEEAVNTLSKAMHDYLRGYASMYSKLFGNSFIYKILQKAIIKKMLSFNNNGWKIVKGSKGKKDIYFEVHKCLVYEILKKEKKLELGKMFCDADLILYMNLRRTEFIRKGTIIKNSPICDMHFKRYPKKATIDRYKSV